jgi:fluoride exporter
MAYIMVGLGGAFGSVARYVLGKIISKKLNKSLPIATFFINITGAMLLGLVTSFGFNDNAYHFFADGFLGAYTTFSTFMYEGFVLFQGKKRLNAIVYIVGSVALGIFGYIAGYELGKWACL